MHKTRPWNESETGDIIAICPRRSCQLKTFTTSPRCELPRKSLKAGPDEEQVRDSHVSYRCYDRLSWKHLGTCTSRPKYLKYQGSTQFIDGRLVHRRSWSGWWFGDEVFIFFYFCWVCQQYNTSRSVQFVNGLRRNKLGEWMLAR